MNDSHIMSEEDQLKACPCCGKRSGRRHWRSMFDTSNIHYKECNCSECGYRMTIKVPFIGTGHDSWNRKFRNIDSRIEEEEEE